jgi:alanine-glyoxylate transaminase / serine-glyoxylate transaminase / serine-pyruvate transaminase
MSPGRALLQVPGPTNVPERVLQALARPIIDHRSPAFAEVALEVLGGLKDVFRTSDAVALYSGSGTGAWEAALTNALSPGDTVLLCESGQFAVLWGELAERLGLRVQRLSGDWRLPPDPDAAAGALEADIAHAIAAVLVVHNETSTGVTADIPAFRDTLEHAQHPALLLVDAVSSLGSMEYRHDEWGVDVTISASQKGLMLPPGLALNAVSERARTAGNKSRFPRGFWAWDPNIAANRTGYFPTTPATGLLFGLREALALMREEGATAVFERHRRHGAATRQAVEAWGLEVYCRDPAAASPVVTAAMVPAGADVDTLRAAAVERFDLSLGAGLGPLAERVFRIGHLGDFNDLMLCATLCGVELALEAAGIPYERGGVASALDLLGRPSPERKPPGAAGPGW